MFVVLLTFLSASLPRKPMRVILLRYIRFSCSARLSRAPGSKWARLPRPEAAFLGGPARGSQNRNGAGGKAEASQAPGAAKAPKQCAQLIFFCSLRRKRSIIYPAGGNHLG